MSRLLASKLSQQAASQTQETARRFIQSSRTVNRHAAGEHLAGKHNWLELYQSYQSKPRFHPIKQTVSFCGLSGTRAEWGEYGRD